MPKKMITKNNIKWLITGTLIILKYTGVINLTLLGCFVAFWLPLLFWLGLVLIISLILSRAESNEEKQVEDKAVSGAIDRLLDELKSMNIDINDFKKEKNDDGNGNGNM